MDERDIVMFLEQNEISRRDALRAGLLGGAGLAGMFSLLDITSVSAHDLAAGKGSMTKLIAAAKKDGQLNTIALPPDWANYGEIIKRFKAKYKIPLTNANPTYSSAQEVQAITSLKGQDRAPDVVDVGTGVLKDALKAKLFKPYKVSTWNTIPKRMKDSKGYWTGDYWGISSFITNQNVVKEAPKEWDDLTSSTLKGKVAIDGDPRTAFDAFGAVMAASLANGGSLSNIEPGINWFAKLKKMGNFISADAYTAPIVQGSTPVAIKWDYLNLAVQKDNPKVPLKITFPKTGKYAGYYCQALSAYAPNPNAAKLWLEFLYSDEGQLLFLKGFTHPARYSDLVRRKKVPKALAAQLPPPSVYKGVKFASLKQIADAGAMLQEQWGPKVAGS